VQLVVVLGTNMAFLVQKFQFRCHWEGEIQSDLGSLAGEASRGWFATVFRRLRRVAQRVKGRKRRLKGSTYEEEELVVTVQVSVY
jgi:hypothetical protein